MYSPKYLAVGYSVARSSYLPQASVVMSAARDEIDGLIPDKTFEGLPFGEVSLVVQIVLECDLNPLVLDRHGSSIGASVNLEGRRIQAMTDAERRIALCYTLIRAVAMLVQRYGGDAQILEPIVKKYSHLPDGTSTPERLGMLPGSEQAAREDENEDDLFGATEITVEYKIEGFGTPEDLQKRHDVESVLNWALRQAGAGEVTGGEIGSGAMTVFCESDDPDYAVGIIRDALASTSLNTGATIHVGE